MEDDSEAAAEEVADNQDGVRLLARGMAISLKDGPHALRFDYEALEFIEEEFEGIDNFMAALGETRLKQKRLRSIRLGITAALLHERSQAQPLGEFRDSIIHKLEPRELVNYLDGLTAAIMQAFPPPTEADKAPKANGSGDSRGNGSTGSPRSNTGAKTASSGA